VSQFSNFFYGVDSTQGIRCMINNDELGFGTQQIFKSIKIDFSIVVYGDNF
jgi:hypothetical protein